MLKAVIYARYSSDNQREESIEAQIRAINLFAEQNGYKIVKPYIDEALSAKTDNRPQFLQMIADSKKSMFDAVICHKLDRFARNRYDSAFYKKTLKDNGVRLISVLENLDDSPESIILESVLEGMAEYYSVNLAREVMKGLKENALQCKHTGGKPPFGYDVDSNKKYIVNTSESEAIKRMFDMVNSNESIGNIIKWLKEGNYKTKYSTAFTASSINAIIRNEKYKGVYVYGKYNRSKQDGIQKNNPGENVIRINDGIPSIVSVEVWEKANKIYNTRLHKAGGQAKAKETYLLSGIIECGLCNGSMCGNKVKSGRSKTLRITYKCNTRKAKKTCDAKDIRKDLVENIVINEVDKLISSNGLDKLVNYLYEEIKNINSGIPTEVKELTKRMSVIDKQINSLVDAIADGLYSSSVKDKLNQAENEKQDIVDRMNFLKSRSDVTNIPDKEYIKNYFQNDMNIRNKKSEDQQRIIRKYVKKVVVCNGCVNVYSQVDTLMHGSAPLVVSTYSYIQAINLEPVYEKVNMRYH